MSLLATWSWTRYPSNLISWSQRVPEGTFEIEDASEGSMKPGKAALIPMEAVKRHNRTPRNKGTQNLRGEFVPAVGTPTRLVAFGKHQGDTKWQNRRPEGAGRTAHASPVRKITRSGTKGRRRGNRLRR
jgi:hypothetical protein